MSITYEWAQRWPKSRRLADAFIVQWAVVYTAGKGLAAELASSEHEADTRAVEI